MKKVAMVLMVLALVAFAMPVFATPPVLTANQTAVNIEVKPTVDMWTNNAAVNLVLDGKTGTMGANADFAVSGVSYIVNVAADITAMVDGTLPSTLINGGGINFFIYPNQASTDAAKTAMITNAYAPAGALVWNNGSLGEAQDFASVVAGPSIRTIPLVYAANAPGEMPAVADWDLVVTYTITAAN